MGELGFRLMFSGVVGFQESINVQYFTGRVLGNLQVIVRMAGLLSLAGHSELGDVGLGGRDVGCRLYCRCRVQSLGFGLFCFVQHLT